MASKKAIPRNGVLLDEVIDVICNTHPWLAEKVCIRSAHAAVRELSAVALLNKAPSMRRKTGECLLCDVCAINTADSDVLARIGYHSDDTEYTLHLILGVCK